jgi:type I restriction enzyme S subunit
MELKEGYKKSEFGFIPIEWDISTISDCVESNGLIRGPFGGALKKEYFVPSGFKVYEQKNAIYKSIELGQYFIDKEKFVELSRFQIKANDFIVSCSGTIGRIYLIPKQHKEGVINQALLIIRINSSKCSRAYFEHCFTSDWFQSKIIDGTQGGAMKNMVGMAEFKMTTFPLPPLPEQTAIANALSDMDALISQTEKLIEKKKAIKQGAMQELLKPKDGWVIKKLGDVCNVLDNLRKPLNDAERQKMKGNIPYCGANGVVGFVNDFVIDDDIILMAEDGGYFDEYKTRPIAYQMKGKCWVNNHAHILKAKKEYDQDFIFYSIVHKNILDYINGGTRAKLNKGELINIMLSIPNNIVEQREITEILADISRNIDSIETKLTKLKKQKQGMMQALLTGKIRLVS